MQTALPSCDSQRVFVMQLVTAHGWVPFTHAATGGHGARMHSTVFRSQKPSPQSRPAQGSAEDDGAGVGGASDDDAGPGAGSAAPCCSEAGADTESVDVGARFVSLHATARHPRPIVT